MIAAEWIWRLVMLIVLLDINVSLAHLASKKA